MLSDKIINKITGRNMETVPMTLEQIVALINKTFISSVNTDEDYDAIIKTVKGNMFVNKELTSKDGKYELHRGVPMSVSIFNLKDHNTIWIHDTETDKYYEYSAYSFKKLNKSIRELIANKKAGI